MSNEAIDAVRYCSKSKGGQRLIMYAIADSTSRETECCHVGTLRMIAGFCNYTERYVRGRLPHLIKLGELVVKQQIGRKSLYWIPILEGEEGYDPMPCHDETHECKGYHTPLDRNRYTIKTGEVFKRRAALQQSKRAANPGTRVHPGSRVPPTPEHVFRGTPEHVILPPRNTSSPLTHSTQDLLPNKTQEAPSIDQIDPTIPDWPTVFAWGKSEQGRAALREAFPKKKIVGGRDMLRVWEDQRRAAATG